MGRIVVVGASVAALLASAAAGAANTTARGEVTGVIRLCGGPAPGRCFTQDGTVYVLGLRNRELTMQRTRHARFSFHLPAGRYTLLAKTGGTRGEQPIAIRPGVVLHANVVIAVP